MSPKKITKPLDIYVRVSDVRGRSGDSYITKEVQEERCRALALARGYEIGDVLTDEDVSGGKMKRPSLDEAIRRIERGTSGGIIVAKLDRFARTLVGGLKTLEEINDLGGVVIVADGEFDTSTATGELVLNMMLSLAQFELRRIKENWTSAQDKAVKRGVHVTRHVPPGYARGDDKRFVPDPKHAETMREAFRRAAAGAPYAQIAAYLNERKLPSGGNATNWQANRIKRLLANRVYLGEARYGTITNPEAHEPLVSQTDFLLAQRGESGVSLKPTTEYLLSGLCRCAECMYAMKPQKGRDRAVGVYRCSGSTATGRCPHPSSITMSRLDEYILEQFLDSLTMSEPEAPLEIDNSAAIAAIEDARAAVAEVEALKGSLRPAAYAQALESAFEQLEAAEEALPSRIIASDVFSKAGDDLQAILARFEAGSSLRELVGDDVATFRNLLATRIQVVLVSPAASRSKTAPIADRVRIVWADEEPLTVPKRGERFEPTLTGLRS